MLYTYYEHILSTSWVKLNNSDCCRVDKMKLKLIKGSKQSTSAIGTFQSLPI